MRPAASPGSGLILSLLAVTVLSLLALTVYQISRTLVRESVYQLRLAQAQAIAEAGLEDALYRLRENYTWRTGLTRKPFAGGSYTVRISTDSTPWVTSTGYSSPIFLIGPAAKTVRVRARFSWSEAQNAAIQANSIMLGGTSLVDAYDSALNQQPVSSPGANIWANNHLEIKKGAGLWGRADYAGGASVAIGAVQGPVVQSTYTRTLPSTPYPGTNNNTSLLSCAYDPTTRDLNADSNGCPAPLSPGTYFLHDVHAASGTIRAQTEDGAVAIYINGDLQLGQYGQLANASKIPSLLQIFARGGTINLNSAQPLYADIQAPTSRCLIGPLQILYGRIACDKVLLEGTLHFDQELGRGEPLHVDWEPGSWSLSYVRAK